MGIRLPRGDGDVVVLRQCGDEISWYEKNSSKVTREVAQLRPNDWGLYDTHGNVLEWCLDFYATNYEAQEHAILRDRRPVSAA